MHDYSDSSITVKYSTTQNRFHGNYISYYRTGIKKAEGSFDNNCRIGKWTVWDTLGRLRMQRIYKTPYNFIRLIPAMTTDASIQLMTSQPVNAPNYDKDGYLQYSYIEESNVIWAKRVSSFISANQNPLICKTTNLYQVIISNILNEKLSCYKDEEFRHAPINKVIDTSRTKLIGYKLVSDVFFDFGRLITEDRPQGICPVLINTITMDTTELCWIYFPQLRPFMSKISISPPVTINKIKTIDDLFFYHYFYAQIIRDVDLYDYNSKTFITQIIKTKNESEKIKLHLIETEHDIWVNFTK